MKRQENQDIKFKNTGPERIPVFPDPISIGELRASLFTEVVNKVRILNESRLACTLCGLNNGRKKIRDFKYRFRALKSLKSKLK